MNNYFDRRKGEYDGRLSLVGSERCMRERGRFVENNVAVRFVKNNVAVARARGLL